MQELIKKSPVEVQNAFFATFEKVEDLKNMIDKVSDEAAKQEIAEIFALFLDWRACNPESPQPEALLAFFKAFPLYYIERELSERKMILDQPDITSLEWRLIRIKMTFSSRYSPPLLEKIKEKAPWLFMSPEELSRDLERALSSGIRGLKAREALQIQKDRDCQPEHLALFEECNKTYILPALVYFKEITKFYLLDAKRLCEIEDAQEREKELQTVLAELEEKRRVVVCNPAFPPPLSGSRLHPYGLYQGIYSIFDEKMNGYVMRLYTELNRMELLTFDIMKLAIEMFFLNTLTDQDPVQFHPSYRPTKEDYSFGKEPGYFREDVIDHQLVENFLRGIEQLQNTQQISEWQASFLSPFLSAAGLRQRCFIRVAQVIFFHMSSEEKWFPLLNYFDVLLGVLLKELEKNGCNLVASEDGIDHLAHILVSCIGLTNTKKERAVAILEDITKLLPRKYARCEPVMFAFRCGLEHFLSSAEAITADSFFIKEFNDDRKELFIELFLRLSGWYLLIGEGEGRQMVVQQIALLWKIFQAIPDENPESRATFHFENLSAAYIFAKKPLNFYGLSGICRPHYWAEYTKPDFLPSALNFLKGLYLVSQSQQELEYFFSLEGEEIIFSNPRTLPSLEDAKKSRRSALYCIQTEWQKITRGEHHAASEAVEALADSVDSLPLLVLRDCIAHDAQKISDKWSRFDWGVLTQNPAVSGSSLPSVRG